VECTNKDCATSNPDDGDSDSTASAINGWNRRATDGVNSREEKSWPIFTMSYDHDREPTITLKAKSHAEAQRLFELIADASDASHVSGGRVMETRKYRDGTIACGPAPLPVHSPEEQDASRLLIRGAKQLRAWHVKYGEHQPQWLPPAGDVRWLEDVQAHLDGVVSDRGGDDDTS
jgi:hypothetical protein